jgi:hypothetical protein
MPSMIGGGTSARLLAIALTAILALTVASLIVGTLEPLPSVALGAAWLLHVERVVAAVLAISAIITLVLRSAHGQLPLKLGAASIEFESLSTAASASIETLNVELRALHERIDDLERQD